MKTCHADSHCIVVLWWSRGTAFEPAGTFSNKIMVQQLCKPGEYLANMADLRFGPELSLFIQSNLYKVAEVTGRVFFLIRRGRKLIYEGNILRL